MQKIEPETLQTTLQKGRVAHFVSNAEVVQIITNGKLVGGFNPFEKYESNWVHLPQFSSENKQNI